MCVVCLYRYLTHLISFFLYITHKHTSGQKYKNHSENAQVLVTYNYIIFIENLIKFYCIRKII